MSYFLKLLVMVCMYFQVNNILLTRDTVVSSVLESMVPYISQHTALEMFLATLINQLTKSQEAK